jgi:hypothetical protein
MNPIANVPSGKVLKSIDDLLALKALLDDKNGLELLKVTGAERAKFDADAAQLKRDQDSLAKDRHAFECRVEDHEEVLQARLSDLEARTQKLAADQAQLDQDRAQHTAAVAAHAQKVRQHQGALDELARFKNFAQNTGI